MTEKLTTTSWAWCSPVVRPWFAYELAEQRVRYPLRLAAPRAPSIGR
ncbi:MAG: hypothetical protein R2716_09750 [Microthrixaceae bacterium]